MFSFRGSQSLGRRFRASLRASSETPPFAQHFVSNLTLQVLESDRFPRRPTVNQGLVERNLSHGSCLKIGSGIYCRGEEKGRGKPIRGRQGPEWLGSAATTSVTKATVGARPENGGAPASWSRSKKVVEFGSLSED